MRCASVSESCAMRSFVTLDRERFLHRLKSNLKRCVWGEGVIKP